jgi:hypothetical protein
MNMIVCVLRKNRRRFFFVQDDFFKRCEPFGGIAGIESL